MFDPVVNFGKVTLASGGIAAGAVTAYASSGTGSRLPDPSTSGAFNLVVWDATTYPDPADDPSVEIVRCTARTADTLTITRAQEGTADANHNTSGHTNSAILAYTKKTYDDQIAGLSAAGGSWYVARLYHDGGTGDPSASVIRNTLSAPVQWTRSEAGLFWGTLAGAFPAGKVFFYQPNLRIGALGGEFTAFLDWANTDVITLSVLDAGGSHVDGFLDMCVRVEVFP